MNWQPMRSRVWLALAAAITYFVIYPDDLSTVLRPLEAISKSAAAVLAVSQSVSPWLYGLAAVIAICWTLLRVCPTHFPKKPE